MSSSDGFRHRTPLGLTATFDAGRARVVMTIFCHVVDVLFFRSDLTVMKVTSDSIASSELIENRTNFTDSSILRALRGTHG